MRPCGDTSGDPGAEVASDAATVVGAGSSPVHAASATTVQTKSSVRHRKLLLLAFGMPSS